MPSNATRVLVVTRASFADPIVAELRREAVEVEHATSATDVDAAIFDVIVVDDGLADWRALIAQGASVIVFADHADCDTVTATLAAGADDVVTRADRPHETVARVRALTRRRPKPPPTDHVIRVGAVELDPASRRVTSGSRPVELTRLQFDLLEFFLRQPGRVHTRETLLEHVWDMAATQDVNAVEVQVRRLREALGDDLREPRLLRTVRGVGYLFER
jgi:DNA-binding response OmpR family regulator